MIEEKIQSEIEVAVQAAFPTSKFKMGDIEVSRPNEKGHGDFSTNIAFKLAGELKKSPKEIAEKLAGAFPANVFDKVEAVNGFLNFYLKKEHYYSILSTILTEKEKYADLDILKGKKIQVEFISANPTGPLTLGNSRGGFPGDALANVLLKAGAKVEREYYLNNGGNQIKMLGDSVLAVAGIIKLEGDYYKGEYIDSFITTHKDDIENLKSEPFKLGQIASQTIVDEYLKPVISKMGIHYDNWFDELELVQAGEVEKVLELLEKKKLIYEKDGAKWFKSTEFGDEKDRVVVKSDGLYTYCAGDFAYHWNKLAVRKFDKVIDIWGADHHGDVLRVLGAVDALGFGGQLNIVLAQFVRLIKDGKEYKMSKRKGTYVTMDDLLELIGGDVQEASDVARFFFLMRSFNTHMDFDLDLAKERSDKNPVFYVKYAYARICSILKKAEILHSVQNDKKMADLTLLTAPEEIELIDQMSQLPQLIASIATFDEYPVHYLTFYAIDLAKKFHVFYDKCRVIDEDNLPLTAARLNLVRATQIVLGIVMRDLIGIDAPEKM